MTYLSHNDETGLTVRRVAAAHQADRARMLATEQERDMGCVTLYMSKYELQARLRNAALMHRFPPVKFR